MSRGLQILLLAVVLVFFFVVISLLKKKKLSLRYTLLWLGLGVVLLILVLFPPVLHWISGLLGIASEMNALYVLLIGGLVVLSLYLTSLASDQSDRIRRLVQELSMLEKRVRELEKKEKEQTGNELP